MGGLRATCAGLWTSQAHCDDQPYAAQQHTQMKGDRALCMAAVAQDWRAHKYASKEVQQDRHIKVAVMEAIKR